MLVTRPHTLPSLAALLLLASPIACKKIAADTTPAEPAATEAPAEERPEAPKHVGDFSDEDLERLKMMGAEMAKHIEAARAANDAEDWATAIAEYEKALALDEDNPHLHAALGWAEFNAGKLDAAERNFRLALRFERDYARRAAYLYKLGRVDEERGDWVAAKKHYDHSLRLVDDPEARAHDEAVAAKASKACKKGKCAKPDYADLTAACAAMLERVHMQLGLAPHEADQGFTCNPEAARRVELTGGDATEAVLLKISGEHGIVEEEEWDLLAKIEGGWHWVGTVLDVENPHKDGIFRSGGVLAFEAKELMPDSPGLEVLVKVELEESDADLDDNVAYHDEREAVIVCGINHGQHVCREIPTRLLFEAEALDVTRPANVDTAAQRFTASAEFDGAGNVTVTGDGHEETFKLADLPEPRGFVFLHDD